MFLWGPGNWELIETGNNNVPSMKLLVSVRNFRKDNQAA
jgi:hypothetical protein